MLVRSASIPRLTFVYMNTSKLYVNTWRTIRYPSELKLNDVPNIEYRIEKQLLLFSCNHTGRLSFSLFYGGKNRVQYTTSGVSSP